MSAALTETPEAVPRPSRVVELHIDTPLPTLMGWASFAPGSIDPLGGTMLVSLFMGDTRVGTIRRHVARPDVDGHAGYVGAPKGFAAELQGVSDFAVLTGMALELRIQSDSAEPIRELLDAGRLGSTMRLAQGKDLHLADMWFATSRRVVLRFEGDDQRRSFLFLQADPRQAQQAVFLTGVHHGTPRLATVEVELLNPYLPLLIVVLDEDGQIFECDTIAFPSLLRGGAHSAEGRCASIGNYGLAGIQAYSSRLAEALVLHRSGAATAAWPRLMCLPATDDASDGGALEDPAMCAAITWFGGAIGQLRDDDSQAAEAYPERIVLRMPSDAYPTLSALMLPMFDTGDTGDDGSDRAPPYLVSFAEGQGWLVSPPLERTDSAIRIEQPAGRSGRYVAELPVAIRQIPASTAIRESILFRRAVDSVMRSDEVAGGVGSVTVVIASTRDGQPPVALLQSVHEQAGFEHGLVIYSVLSSDGEQRALPYLEALFPGRYLVVLHHRPMSRAREFQAVAGFSPASELLLLGPETVLHDPMALVSLVGRRKAGGWGTMSPLLIDVALGAPRFANAGFFLRGVDFQGISKLVFASPDVLGIMPETFAAAAVPLAAVAIDRDVLIGLSIVDAPWDVIIQDELRLGLAVAASGRQSGVTLAISATTGRDDFAGAGVAAFMPASVGLPALNALARQATGLQRL